MAKIAKIKKANTTWRRVFFSIDGGLINHNKLVEKYIYYERLQE